MSGTARTVATYAPDGTEVTYTTAAKWDTAGIVQNLDGTWRLAAHGFSADSVRTRTLTYYNRHNYLGSWSVGPLWDATIPMVREYFGSHQVRIHTIFTPDAGWQVRNIKAGRAQLRMLAREGVTAVEIQQVYTGRCADFQMAELLKSMRARKVTA